MDPPRGIGENDRSIHRPENLHNLSLRHGQPIRQRRQEVFPSAHSAKVPYGPPRDPDSMIYLNRRSLLASAGLALIGTVQTPRQALADDVAWLPDVQRPPDRAPSAQHRLSPPL